MDVHMKNLKILLFAAFVCVSGCTRKAVYDSAPNSYYLNPTKNIKNVGRVALVELTSRSVVPQLSINVTDSLFQEIQKKQIFSLIKIMQDDPVWRRLPLHPEMNISFEEMAQMRNMLKCDAVLVGSIMGFEPYPHMTIGLRLRLIDLSDGELIWAMEQVWDTTDKSTQQRIEAYYNPKVGLLKDENLSGQLGSVSVLKFLKFVAYEVTSTMQTAR